MKKCIIMHFFRRKTQKVHYSALFGGGKNRKSSLPKFREQSSRSAEKRLDVVETGDSCTGGSGWDGARLAQAEAYAT